MHEMDSLAVRTTVRAASAAMEGRNRRRHSAVRVAVAVFGAIAVLTSSADAQRATPPPSTTTAPGMIPFTAATPARSADSMHLPDSVHLADSTHRSADGAYPSHRTRLSDRTGLTASRDSSNVGTIAVPPDRLAPQLPSFEVPVPMRRSDSLVSAAVEAAASRDSSYHIVVSLARRWLWVVSGPDTLFEAPVGVGMDAELTYAGRHWLFRTPRGARVVRAKTTRPVWIPPDWHYVEVAREHGLRLARLTADRPVTLDDGSRLELRAGTAGIIPAGPDSSFEPLPTDEEIVFDSTLFVPPVGTRNRAIEGELGAYQLDLGGGYLLHGTPHDESIGTATTHGCVRLHDGDIAWLYDHVPVGTRVYVY